ncbi:hypothetical protein [Pantoea sp. Lij88]|uniref:hypothetical protein n=1 Tax=Pantoea sp. Lij88 TaxID=3028622 RepID=UPI0024BA9492|nr:hypothetical protein [Pantoea sp. Lij88]WHQ73432.1 hypothetical protein PU624_00895 [Pantoea sp. Lij88]
MEYAFSSSGDSFFSPSSTLLVETSILGIDDCCGVEYGSATAELQYAYLSSRLEKTYYSGVELDDLAVFDNLLIDVKELYLQILIDVFPKLGHRLSALAKVEDGWDGHDANSMSFESLGTFKRFLLKADLFADDIGIYLDHNGSFIISYTDPMHGLVDMTFNNQVIEVCADELEMDMSIADAVAFVKTKR